VVWTLGHRVDLVAEDYYAQEVGYQRQIDTQRRSRALTEKPTWQVDPARAALVLRFPEALRPRMQAVQMCLYRPSDKALDRTIPVLPAAEEVALDVSALPGGLWRISLEWTQDGQAYALGGSLHLPGQVPGLAVDPRTPQNPALDTPARPSP